ncbi:hypothetical protein J2Y66_003472 [Paenarthrobacter nitroguajacolicus]|uniref:endonuclease VII domain-containing protein n=1 Tax=Paenarthrobacter nitroguajacolicus TaxID=211146 RepID=UPI00285D3B58|nr:hypothetical protein [Paenarthrobacter nitroguajacolicus]
MKVSTSGSNTVSVTSLAEEISTDSGPTRNLPEPRGCIGPGRNGQQFCGKPTESRRSVLCVAHSSQRKNGGSLQPLRTRTNTSKCIGPGQDGGACGRSVFSRPVGEDDGVCKTHYDQLKRRGFMSPIGRRLPPLSDKCSGPGRDGSALCGRPAEARDTLLCSPHDRQLKKNGVLRPIRMVNTPEGPCVGPGPNGASCGRPMENKAHRLCQSHYAQRHRGKELTPLKLTRKRGEVARCGFEGCRYNDAPGGEGYCHHHWRQLHSGQDLTPLKRKLNRGRSVLDRDENGNKLCIGCLTWKSESDFSKVSAARDGLNYKCSRCHASIRMERVYGVDLDHYEAMLAAQGGCCKICRRPAPAGQNRFAVDHNHRCCPGTLSCGHCIRGLLCQPCNQGLGLLQENGNILRQAAEYVLLNDAAFAVRE